MGGGRLDARSWHAFRQGLLESENARMDFNAFRQAVEDFTFCKELKEIKAMYREIMAWVDNGNPLLEDTFVDVLQVASPLHSPLTSAAALVAVGTPQLGKQSPLTSRTRRHMGTWGCGAASGHPRRCRHPRNMTATSSWRTAGTVSAPNLRRRWAVVTRLFMAPTASHNTSIVKPRDLVLTAATYRRSFRGCFGC